MKPICDLGSMSSSNLKQICIIHLLKFSLSQMKIIKKKGLVLAKNSLTSYWNGN